MSMGLSLGGLRLGGRGAGAAPPVTSKTIDRTTTTVDSTTRTIDRS